MKYCKRCDLTKPRVEFTPSAGRYDGLQPYCRECMKLYRREHYQSNKKQYRDRNHKTQAKLRAVVLEIKNGPCVDCGNSFPGEPWIMEFDHREPDKKSGDISRFVSNGSEKLLREEISKCDLVCAICHRRRTAQRGSWVDNRLAHVLE